MNTSNSAIRKGLLTSCPRIGLSKRWKTNSFKSPLIQQKVTLKYDSPVNETPTSSLETTPVTMEAKRKSEALDESTSKRVKRETEPKRRAKKRLLDNDSLTDETEKVNVLNVSGCELLTSDEKSVENVLTESKKLNKQNEDKSPKVRELCVNVVKLSSDQLNPKKNLILNQNEGAVEVGIKNEKLKNISKRKEKRNERSQESTNVTKKRAQEVEKSLKEEIKRNKNMPEALEENKNGDVSSRKVEDITKKENNSKKEIEKLNCETELGVKKSNNQILKRTDDENQTKKIDKKGDALQNNTDPKNFSPKTIVSQLETKPLLDPLDDSFMNKERAVNKQTSKSKISIDEYIKRKEKRKTNLSSSSSKLSMKQSSANSDSLESDEELLEKPNVQKSIPQSKNVDRSDVIDKILQLERVISDKEGELERHKQAEVYHKIHDVKKLESLTRTWKNGCQNALQDLLLKLKEHANIDMPGLLNRLGAPAGLISYDVENGVFT